MILAYFLKIFNFFCLWARFRGRNLINVYWALPRPAKGNNFLWNPKYLVPKLVCFANFALAHKKLRVCKCKLNKFRCLSCFLFVYLWLIKILFGI